MAAFDRRTITGGVPATVLSSSMDGSTLSISIDDATGWPTGSVGDWGVVIDRGTASEEKCLIDSRTTTTLTVASGGRGYDGSVAVSHVAGATIEHCLLAQDADEANAHISDDSYDHHSQYMRADGTRHDLEARHTFGGAYGTPAAASDIGTTPATGSGNNPAREDHVHQIGTGAIDGSAMFAAGVVDAAAIATDAVGTAEIAADAVTASEIAAGAVGASELATDAVSTVKIQADAVTAAKIADDAIDSADKIADAIITIDKLASEAGTNYTPTLTNVTLGSGGTSYGRYFKFGRLVVGVAGFTLGTSGNVTGNLSIGVPFACAAGSVDWIMAARATGTGRASGMGVIEGGASSGGFFATIGTSQWDATNPFNWDNGDVFRAVFLYEAAT